MTSVKQFSIETPATSEELGEGAFLFTDDYSVFDWGKMPDEIPDKGAALCAMGAANFERLEDAGIPTHYRGVRRADREVVPISSVEQPPTEMAIDLTQVPELPHEGRSYDYEAYHAAAGENYLIPLEIVFRNQIPVGSSLRRRTDPTDHGLEGDTWPDRPCSLSEPIVEFSTKYEESDRYLSREEAGRIAGVAAVDTLESIALEVNRLLTDRAAAVGMTHQDGKIECLYYQGEVRVADVVGTFDENRFAYEGQQLSKEVLRQYHKRTQSEWVQAVDAAKTRAKADDVADWKARCEHRPESLDQEIIEIARDMYASGANTYLGRSLFEAPAIDEAVHAVRSLSPD